MKLNKIIIAFIFMSNYCFSTSIHLTGVSDSLVFGNNSTYDSLIIDSSQNISIYNCKFLTPISVPTKGRNVARIKHSKNIHIQNCSFNGNSIACTGIRMDTSNLITVYSCKIHNVNDDGIEVLRCNNLKILNNEIFDLKACGYDKVKDSCGPCVNGHSDGIELGYCNNVIMIGNLIYSIDSKGFAGFELGFPNVGLTIYNNIVYTPSTNTNIRISNTDTIKVFNNIFWEGNDRNGNGKVEIQNNVHNLSFYNNIANIIKFNFKNNPPDTNNLLFDYNFIYDPTNSDVPFQQNDITGGWPQFKNISYNNCCIDVSIEDFELPLSSIFYNSGTSNNDSPRYDIYRKPRIINNERNLDVGPFNLDVNYVPYYLSIIK